MADEERDIELTVEAETSLTLEGLTEALAAVGVSWDSGSGLLTMKGIAPVLVEELDEKGDFIDPLTEETYEGHVRDRKREEARDALKAFIDSAVQ